MRGEVGGFANGTALIECALRLWWFPYGCVLLREDDAPGCGERVLVNVMVTERDSPAKQEDWAGVTTTLIGDSIAAMFVLCLCVCDWERSGGRGAMS